MTAPALPSGQLPTALYFDADYQPVAPAAAVYEQRAPLRHDAGRQAWHWQLHFAQPPGKLHMDAWLRSADIESPNYIYQRSVYFADGQLALQEERNGEGDFDGVTVAYYADGTLKSRKAYRDGEYEGVHSHYHANGQLSRELRYQAGQPADGEYLSFDEQGQVSNRAHFADGVLEGKVEAFHPNGRLAERGMYLNGQRTGLYEAWWPDGREKSQRQYVHGEKHGLERNWAEDGMRTICAWQDGSLLRPCSHF